LDEAAETMRLAAGVSRSATLKASAGVAVLAFMVWFPMLEMAGAVFEIVGIVLVTDEELFVATV